MRYSRYLRIMIFLVLSTMVFGAKDSFAKTINSLRHGKVSFLQIENSKSFAVQAEKPEGENPEMKSRRFFTQYGNLFGINNQPQELKLIEVSKSDQPIFFGKYKLGEFPTEQPPFMPMIIRTHVKFQQVYNNIPVFCQEVIAHLKENQIQSINAEFTPSITIDSTIPKITAEQAKEKAKQIWESENKQAKYIDTPILYIFNPSVLSSRENHNYLIWYIEIANSATQATEREFLFINAIDGNLVFRLPGIFEAKNIQVKDKGYDPNNRYPNDPEDARNFAGQTYDYYFDKHGRDSFNGAGATIYVNARISGSCPNAYWNGSNVNFCAGMAVRDVVAHELTHAVTQYSSGLQYSYQSGAINEGMSDIFGAAVDNDDWTMGEGSILGIIRYMDDPTRKGQPDRLFSPNYYCGSSDYGGVHKNNGIPNKLAYLMAEGGSFNGCTISGLGREKEERIIYLTATKYLTSSSNFANFYQGILSACEELYGKGSFECQNTDNAAKAVEINQEDAGSQQGAKCRGKTRVAPNCSTTSPVPTTPPTGVPTTTPLPTNPQNQPTNTPQPTTQNPTPSPVSVAIWNTMMQNGQEIILPQSSRLPKGTLISVCYNRAPGEVTITVDRGNGLTSSYSGVLTDSVEFGCLHSGQQRFFPLGDLADQQGSLHSYTINNNGQTASTNLLVTTGDIFIPTAPPTTEPTNIPTATIIPTTPPGQPTNTPPPTGGPTSIPTATPLPTNGPTPTTKSSSLQNLINSVSEDKLKEYLTNLVDDDEIAGQDEQQTRYSRYQGHITESEYAKNLFQSFSLETQSQDFSFSKSGTTFNTRNVIARLPGNNANQVYLITAHLDSTAANSGTNDPAPGADDNGSGSVSVLEAARVLKNSGIQFNSTIEFILFSGEEQGLYGSSYYVNHRDTNKTIKGVANLDMIANRGSSGDCVTFGYRAYNGGNVISDKIVAMNNQYQINLTASSVQSSITASDHAPFWQAGIPAIFGFECDFSSVYHTTSDKTDRINFDQLTKTVKTVTAAIASLALE